MLGRLLENGRLVTCRQIEHSTTTTIRVSAPSPSRQTAVGGEGSRSSLLHATGFRRPSMTISTSDASIEVTAEASAALPLQSNGDTDRNHGRVKGVAWLRCNNSPKPSRKASPG